jgi:hypothetical protein
MARVSSPRHGGRKCLFTGALKDLRKTTKGVLGPNISEDRMEGSAGVQVGQTFRDRHGGLETLGLCPKPWLPAQVTTSVHVKMP